MLDVKMKFLYYPNPARFSEKGSGEVKSLNWASLCLWLNPASGREASEQLQSFSCQDPPPHKAEQDQTLSIVRAHVNTMTSLLVPFK